MANVRAREPVRLDEGDEILDQILEENVVFPERVVGVNQKGIASHHFLSRQKDLNITNLSLTVSTRPLRFPRRHSAGRVCAPLLSCELDAADRSTVRRFSMLRREDCCSGWPRLLRADGRHCALPGRGWGQ